LTAPSAKRRDRRGAQDSAPPARAEADVLGDNWTAAWGGREEFADWCTAEVAYEDPIARLPLTGSAAIAAHAARLRAVFPDAAVDRAGPALLRGQNACVPWLLTGTNTGDLPVLPATGKRLELHGLHYLELVDGRVHRARGFFDLYEAATQLGVLPARGGIGETALLLLRGFGLRL
jgi:predicted ester cyclase